MTRILSSLALGASMLFFANCACPKGNSCTACAAGTHTHKCTSTHCSACAKGKCCGKCAPASAATCTECAKN
jgi:hypothetical protein